MRGQLLAPDEPEESPTAWFAVLERALRTNDFALAQKAKERLAALGVVVRLSGLHARRLRPAAWCPLCADRPAGRGGGPCPRCHERRNP
jgi:hypothetical protein